VTPAVTIDRAASTATAEGKTFAVRELTDVATGEVFIRVRPIEGSNELGVIHRDHPLPLTFGGPAAKRLLRAIGEAWWAL
jgi:glycerate-2-kinase